MTDLRREIETKLNIYTKKYHEEYIKCLIRGIEIPIKVRPEELVRQLFLDFMIHESGLFPDLITCMHAHLPYGRFSSLTLHLQQS